MSRSKKTRSLKRNHSGVKTGTKERTKIESKQKKAKQKLANPRAVTRQRSVYQQHLDNNDLTEGQHAAPKLQLDQPLISLLAQAEQKSANFRAAKKPKPRTPEKVEAPATEEDQEANLWNQLESAPSNDIF